MQQESDCPAPLRGMRVVDFTTVVAGPYCTYQLALLGADVVKVERPGSGDFSRRGPSMAGAPGLTAGYVAQNAAKRSIALDLTADDDRRIAEALLDRADVVVQNFTPGVADRLGIGYEPVKARNPRVVYASLSGYGQTGPMSARPAYDHVMQAISGITMLIGTQATVPNRIGPPMFDYIAGIYGAFAVVSALMERSRTGQGQRLDVAMLDAALVSMASTASNWSNGGIAPRANGNQAASGSPASGTFRTREGMLSLVCNTEEQLRRMCDAMGALALLEDARFCTGELRKTHEEAFRLELQQLLLQRTAAEWEALLATRRVPAVRVRTLDEILVDPHVVEREVMHSVADPETGAPMQVPSIGFRWNHQSIGPARAPSRLDADADIIVRELELPPR